MQSTSQPQPPTPTPPHTPCHTTSFPPFGPQDELIKAKAAVHEAEKAVKLREIELVERDRKVG